LHKQKNQREESKNTRFNEIRQFAYVCRVEGEGDLIKINQVIVGGQYLSLYRQRVLEEKETNRSEFRSETNSESL